MSSPCLAITDLSATTVSNTRNFSNREPTLNGDRRLFQSSPRFFESFFFLISSGGRRQTLSLSYANRRDSSRIRPNNWIVHEFHPPRFLRNELLSKLCVADNFRDCRCARVGKNEEDALLRSIFVFSRRNFSRAIPCHFVPKITHNGRQRDFEWPPPVAEKRRLKRKLEMLVSCELPKMIPPPN